MGPVGDADTIGELRLRQREEEVRGVGITWSSPLLRRRGRFGPGYRKRDFSAERRVEPQVPEEPDAGVMELSQAVFQPIMEQGAFIVRRRIKGRCVACQ